MLSMFQSPKLHRKNFRRPEVLGDLFYISGGTFKERREKVPSFFMSGIILELGYAVVKKSPAEPGV